MISQQSFISLVLAAFLLLSPAFAGGSRVPALMRVQHGTIVAGNPSPLKNALGKPVVLYYWDITCIPCIFHQKDTIEFARAVQRAGGRFFSIHHGMKQTTATLQHFAKKEKVPFTIARGGKGPSSVRTLPRMFVFNRKGDLVYQGAIGKLAVDAFQAQVNPSQAK